MTTKGGSCCNPMQTQLDWSCPDHAEASDCPDALVGCFKSGRHGLYIHDGGLAYIEIAFCPWCGNRLEGRKED